jgi:hypothetical protein
MLTTNHQIMNFCKNYADQVGFDSVSGADTDPEK